VKQSLSSKLILSSKKSNTSIFDETFLSKSEIGAIFSWNEISEIHRVRHAIYQCGGRLISLLTDFGLINACYPDAHGETKDTILYTGAGSRGDQQLDSFNRAMFEAIETAHAVPLFNKLAVGRWQFLGFWTIEKGVYIYDELQKRMIWKFTLRRSEEN
jgi:hypothetical protein